MTVEKKGNIAVVRVRGQVRVRGRIADTLEMLNLDRVNWAIVIYPSPTYMGMVQKVKDFVTWGEIDEKLILPLVEKWGRKAGGARLEAKEAKDLAQKLAAGHVNLKEAGYLPQFKLHPPSKGHPAEGGIRTHVKVGGALGYRGAAINGLLAVMAGLKEAKPKPAATSKSEAPKKAKENA